MKKVLMIASIVAMGIGLVLGLGNMKTLTEKQDYLVEVKDKVTKVTAELGEAEDERDGAIERETQSKDMRNQAAAAVEGVKQNLKILARSVDDKNSDFKKIDIELKEVELLVRKIFPDGQVETVDEINAKLTMMQETLTEKQAQAANMDAQVAAAMKVKQVEVGKVKKEEEYQMKRAQTLALNGMVATVIAVNNEWGFVMVNAGRAHGVEADSSLLVKRGNGHVARLRIVSLQETASVCDVVKESVARGVKVQPGDKVIFEN